MDLATRQKRVFLGGTCNGSKWRDAITPHLKKFGLDYFNPVVDDWTQECQDREIKERDSADFVLYVITPKMTGVYSVAEVIDDSNKRPEKTVFIVLKRDGDDCFDKGQLRSLAMVAKMVKDNGGVQFMDLGSAAYWMGQQA